jgi:tetrahydromethanopterin S-methyltransferase subunit D
MQSTEELLQHYVAEERRAEREYRIRCLSFLFVLCLFGGILGGILGGLLYSAYRDH